MRYSVIIPVYNRPDEVDELLQSLTEQSFKDFDRTGLTSLLQIYKRPSTTP